MSRRTAMAAVAVMALLLVTIVPAKALLSFGTPTRISGAGVRAHAEPGAIALAGSNTVGMAWIEPADFDSRVYFRRSTDGGKTWGTRKAISGTTGQSLVVSMSSYRSRFDIVWLQSAGGTTRVWYVRSTDAGKTWDTRKALSPSTLNAFDPRVARDAAGRVAVVWSGEGQTNGVRSRVSTDGGVTFGGMVSVHQANPSYALPVVAIGRYGRIHIVYNDGDSVWYQRSGNDGSSWSSRVGLASGAQTFSGPALAAAGTTVVFGYTAVDGDETWVRIRRSTNNGTSWGGGSSLSPKSASESSQMVISVRSGRWRALFLRCLNDPCTEDAATYLRRSDDGGVTWSSVQRVSSTAHHRALPVGADGDTKTVVAWMRQDNFGAILQVWVRRQT